MPAINRAEVSVGLSTVVARLLAPDAANRPPDAAWVVTQLAGMLPPDPAMSSASLAPGFPGELDFVPPPDPAAGLVATTGTERRSRRGYLVAGGTVLAALVIAAFLLWSRGDSDQLRTTPRQPPPPASATGTTAPAAVRLEPVDPVDLGNQVQLSWSADSGRTLDFAVIVAGGERAQPHPARAAEPRHHGAGRPGAEVLLRAAGHRQQPGLPEPAQGDPRRGLPPVVR
ncbi:hypothetical protein LWP59_01230 [Amycolatopsis acidiphila]|uniref:Uncharacterized protein n=1 Tax=Amycolatopsis acidiphila TaxID=715473 RepID=A0A558AMV6_9PSEU|nr:hypothetical protein [Amycolatopsis acidiphila]TVT25597.1 hypothetical protein FNH06_01975 [Amycolatopsis acidiphila]UIJ60351.1 hypothetical protein LWP59_01230 [Amycolatopsis acidiphila]GHG90549.1 hypothetical protein GCM10017788_66230 [Amycolatopsis acidiphila]